MPRTYGEPFLIELFSPGEKSPGQLLAQSCIKARIPAAFAAKALDVSRITVHAWFRGQHIREKNLGRVNAFMNLLAKDTATGILPVKSIKDAKRYIEDMVGHPI